MQYCAALTQPSVSTQITETLPPDACAAAAGAEAGATGDREDRCRHPAEMNAWVIDLPLFWSVKELANVPPFWFFSSQPRTLTFLLFCLL